MCGQHRFQLLTPYSVHELRSNRQVSLGYSLIEIAYPPKQFKVAQKFVYGFVISLTPLFELHHSLVPLYSRAETIQQDVEYLASAVSLIGSFRHYTIAVPSRLLLSALHSCFLERLSSSKCKFITYIQVSMQPSDSSLYDFGFFSVLLDLSPLSVDFAMTRVAQGTNVVKKTKTSTTTVYQKTGKSDPKNPRRYKRLPLKIEKLTKHTVQMKRGSLLRRSGVSFRSAAEKSRIEKGIR